MMDGRCGALRSALETSNFQDVMIMSLRGQVMPRRSMVLIVKAIGSGKLGSGPDQNPANPKNLPDGLRQFPTRPCAVALDIAEGVDMVMVKLALPYLDIVQRVVETFRMPTFAFQVSRRIPC